MCLHLSACPDALALEAERVRDERAVAMRGERPKWMEYMEKNDGGGGGGGSNSNSSNSNSSNSSGRSSGWTRRKWMEEEDWDEPKVNTV